MREPLKTTPMRSPDLGTPDSVSRFQAGDPATVRAVRRLVLDVLATHSKELKPYWDDLVLEVCSQAWQRVRRGAEEIQNLEGLVARITRAGESLFGDDEGALRLDEVSPEAKNIERQALRSCGGHVWRRDAVNEKLRG